MTDREKLGAKLPPALREWADRVIIPGPSREFYPFELHDFPSACTVSTGTTESSGLKGGSMTRKRYQKGCVILRGDVWYGRYRDDVIGQDSKVTRVLRNTVLGSKKEYPTKRLAERKLELLLHRINAPEYRPGRVAMVAEFAERWQFEILSKRKPSTREAANSHLAVHILPFMGKLRLDAIGVGNQQAFVTKLVESRFSKDPGECSRNTFLDADNGKELGLHLCGREPEEIGVAGPRHQEESALLHRGRSTPDPRCCKGTLAHDVRDSGTPRSACRRNSRPQN